MITKLPKVLADYFAATNAHDVEAMIDAFADDATVHDEGRDHVGADAVRAWMKETIEKYDFTAEPLESSRSGSNTVVLVSLRGNFPGRPITIQYAFTLSGDKVAHLKIG